MSLRYFEEQKSELGPTLRVDACTIYALPGSKTCLESLCEYENASQLVDGAQKRSAVRNPRTTYVTASFDLRSPVRKYNLRYHISAFSASALATTAVNASVNKTMRYQFGQIDGLGGTALRNSGHTTRRLSRLFRMLVVDVGYDGDPLARANTYFQTVESESLYVEARILVP